MQPKRLLEAGYEFRFPELEGALRHLLGRADDRRKRPARLVGLTGATGYIGGRLLGELESAGCRGALHHAPAGAAAPACRRHDRGRGRRRVRLRVAGVRARRASESPTTWCTRWAPAAPSSSRIVLGAENFARAARAAGVGSIVYLGGLGSGDDLSAHLASRQEVGRILRASGVPTIEFRASIIIGSGSLSFEMVRSLVERLPVMMTPRWVGTIAQPIAVEDVIAYLMAALELDPDESAVLRDRRRRSRLLPRPDARVRAAAWAAPASGCRCRCSRRASRASGSG